MAEVMIKIDPAVTCYDPFVPGTACQQLKPFDGDPRCLFGWGPPRCGHSWGHVCSREVGHPGRCWDHAFDDPCAYARRPKDWDSKQRRECNQ